MLFWVLLLIYQAACRVELFVSKSVRLFEQSVEETLTIRGKNLNASPLKRLRFTVDADVFETLKIVRMQEGGVWKTLSDFEGPSFWLTFASPKAEEASFAAEVRLIFRGRLEFVPHKIRFDEDQVVSFEDRALGVRFEDEAEVKNLSINYFWPARNTLNEDNGLIERQVNRDGVEYSAEGIASPFDSVYRFRFQLNKPFDIFSKVERFVEVSLWGNILETNNLYLTNESAELDGEYSTIDFNPANFNTGKNALRWLQTRLDGAVHGLSIRDEVGNVTNPVAKRVGDQIDLILIPRFSLFGGWKSNFFIEFNQPSRPFLTRDSSASDLLRLEYSFGCPFENVMAKEYELNICLPQGSELVSSDLRYGFVANSTFFKPDFFENPGKHCHKFVFKNIIPSLFSDKINITFRVPSGATWGKLIYLIALLSAGTFGIILISKIDFSFEDKRKKHSPKPKGE